jgi:hypothetical protein
MGAKTIGVPLRTDWASSSGDWTLDLEELDAAMSEKTKMLVLNTPHNPTGKVFTRDELKGISDVVMRYPNVTVLSDEVYEFMTFDGLKHERIATLPGMWERTLSVYSAGKTFSATGWRVGYVVGPQPLITPLVRVHQASNFCTPSALQIAIAIALREVRVSVQQNFEVEEGQSSLPPPALPATYTLRRKKKTTGKHYRRSWSGNAIGSASFFDSQTLSRLSRRAGTSSSPIRHAFSSRPTTRRGSPRRTSRSRNIATSRSASSLPSALV